MPIIEDPNHRAAVIGMTSQALEKSGTAAAVVRLDSGTVVLPRAATGDKAAKAWSLARF